MAPPTKNFTVLPDTDIDANSPITVTLMTALRDNDIHLEEWLGGSFVAAIDHDHDGVNSKAVANIDVQTFLSGGTWNKPSDARVVLALLWGGGGGGGGGGGVRGGGGGGGAFVLHRITDPTTLGATETVSVGAGGVGNSAGGNTSFATNYIAYGGGGGNFNAGGNGGGGGGGGGALSAGLGGSSSTSGLDGGRPRSVPDETFGRRGVHNLTPAGDNAHGGGGGAGAGDNTISHGGWSVFGGGGGGGASTGVTIGDGGNSIWGGGGGAGSNNSGTPGSGGTSVYGGAGANGVTNGSGNAGSQPGGGGGGSLGSTGGTGGDGQAIIITFIST